LVFTDTTSGSVSLTNAIAADVTGSGAAAVTLKNTGNLSVAAAGVSAAGLVPLDTPTGGLGTITLKNAASGANVSLKSAAATAGTGAFTGATVTRTGVGAISHCTPLSRSLVFTDTTSGAVSLTNAIAADVTGSGAAAVTVKNTGNL